MAQYAYEVTEQTWNEFCDRYKISDGTRAKIRDAIVERDLTWHDVVVGFTHGYFLDVKGVGQVTVDEVLPIFEGPKAFKEYGEKVAESLKRRQKREIERLQA